MKITISIIVAVLLACSGCSSVPTVGKTVGSVPQKENIVIDPAPTAPPQPSSTPEELIDSGDTEHHYYYGVQEASPYEEDAYLAYEKLKKSQSKTPMIKLSESISHVTHMSSSNVSIDLHGKAVIFKEPKALARLSSPEIKEGQSVLLTLVVSATKSFSELEFAISEQQKFVPNSRNKESSQNVATTIDPVLWSEYEYIKAKVWHCSNFLVCSTDEDVRRSSDKILVWNFAIDSKTISSTSTGYVGLKVYGDNDRQGTFSNEITSFPPLNVSIRVVRDLSWWESKFKIISSLLESIETSLITIGSVFTILIGWTIYLRKKSRHEKT